MKAETASPFTNVLPRTRDKDGTPIPRRFAFSPPVLTHDAEALLEAGATAQKSPEEAKNLKAWLLCWNAVAAAQNVKRLRQDMADSLNERNDQLRRELSEVRPLLVQSRQDEMSKAAELAQTLAGLGLRLDATNLTLGFGPDDPVSLEALSGEHGLPPPSLKPSPLVSWLHKIVAVVGGGTVFGISLGLLMDKLELASVSREAPQLILFALLGMAVMFLIGTSLSPLATSTGGSLYRAGIRCTAARSVLPFLYGGLLLALTIAFVVIESKVEQVGLFKGLVENSSLTSLKLSKTELGFVALTLCLPVVASYVCLGLIEGERLANLSYLAALQAKARDKIHQDERFAKACRLVEELRLARLIRAELEQRVQSLVSGIRETFTLEELHRLEDQEMDAAGISFAAEKALFGQGLEEATAEQKPNEIESKTGRLSLFWSRLKRGWT